MNTTADKIAAIITKPTPAAPVTTHALAELGNGNMQKGLIRITEYFHEESLANLHRGRVQGAMLGGFVATIGIGIFGYVYHRRERKKLEKEEKAILATLRNSTLTSGESKNQTQVIVLDEGSGQTE